ncbi:hypothetical protein PHLH8_20770 [Pseudomonas sp. Pc102]|uniref:hypothetical protein n=1 Tax=Pseudomonas sp. Pc102 TaxID=2678261 RepID=UPI001BCFAC17|nr:hypothetical protein [Pseudomonas sp. Pc102]BBP82435.1 hypothetical protein PHLH8_20770 [Pseudomonas sp. Pc102]
MKWRKIAFLIFVAFALLWLVARAFSWGACSWYGYQTGRDTRYAAFIGCMVKVDERWVPRSELRIVQ